MMFNIFILAIIASVNVLTANAQDFNYIGGIALRTPDTCPAGSVSGQVTFEQNCCGANQTFVKVEGSVCCDSSSDCYAEVVAAPKCADPSWQLCGTNEGDFCCEANWVCFTQTSSGTNGGGVGCSTPGATLTASLQSEITTIYAANAGPGASTATPSTVAARTSSLVTTSAAITSSGSQSQSTLKITSSSSTDTQSTSSSISPSASSSNSISGASPSGSISSKSSSSITSGAIAGIVASALVIISLAFAGGVWFSRRKNNPMRNSRGESFRIPFGGAHEMDTSNFTRVELDDHAQGMNPTRADVHASELAADERAVEMYAGYRN